MTPILHSKIIGSGKPLLILHGFLGMLDNWKTLGNKFSENGFEVHLIDQRNHGKSFHSQEFNYDLMVADLKRYLDFHKLGSILLLGHSMGGKTAMQFACDHKEMTEKLIVADIAPKQYPAHHQNIINGLKTLNFDELKSRGAADNELSKSISNKGIRQFLLKNLFWAEKGRLEFRFNLSVLSDKMDEIGENLSTTNIYQGPTLFLKGDKSGYITKNDLSVIRRYFPLAKLETIENAGHWLHAENPDQFFEKSLVFLNSQ